MTANEIAARIGAHLKAMEADLSYNQYADPKMRGDGTLRPYIGARAYANAGWVNVCYNHIHGWSSLRKVEAEAYLSWLDAGNRGKHWECDRDR